MLIQFKISLVLGAEVTDLGELCPIQYVEGINDGERFHASDFCNVSIYSAVAIEYKPKRNYCLDDAEIMAYDDESLGEREFTVALHPDYLGKPNELAIVEGKIKLKFDNTLSQKGIEHEVKWHKMSFLYKLPEQKLSKGEVKTWNALELNPIRPYSNRWGMLISPLTAICQRLTSRTAKF